MLRRSFLLSSGATLAATAIPSLARANVPVPYDWAATPPVDTRQNFIDWMVKTRGEDPKLLGERYAFRDCVAEHDTGAGQDDREFRRR